MTRVGLALLLAALAQSAAASAQSDSRTAYELSVDRSLTIATGPVDHAVVLDEQVCVVEVVAGGVRLVGLRRGETVILMWPRGGTDDQPTTAIVRVVAPPVAPPATTLTREERDALGQGVVGAMVHVGMASSGASSTSVLAPFRWTAGGPQGRWSLEGQTQSRSGTASGLNLDTLAAQWARNGLTVNAIDVIVDLDGGGDRIVNSAPANTFLLRGADMVIGRGRTNVELFGGSALPSTVLSGHLVGATLRHQINDRRSIFATTAAVRAPRSSDTSLTDDRTSVFQTVGVTERFSPRALLQVRAGAGSGGASTQGSTAWNGERASVSATALVSSPRFGPQQLQLVQAPHTLLRGGAVWRALPRLTASAGYDHTEMHATAFSPDRVSSRNVSSSINVSVAPRHVLYATSIWNRATGSLGATALTTGRRLETGWNAQFGARLTNTLQLSSGALADALDVNSRGEFSIRNTTSATFTGGSMSVSFSHDRLSPSLVSRLRQRIDLLAPELQTLFSDDPIAFVHSPMMPTDVRRLIESLQPIDTALVVSGQFNAGRRLTVTPMLSYTNNVQSPTAETFSEMLGYALTWRATSTLDIQSSLTHALVIDPRVHALSRTTVLGIGVRRTFSGAPPWSSGAGGRRIVGRVFRDSNLDGVAQADEPGVAGTLVRFSDGSTARTDANGRFESHHLKPGEYRVYLSIDQLGAGARVTTPVDQVVRLYSPRVADVTFGVVYFARVVGSVFNDVTMDGIRRPAAPGLRGVTVLVRGDGIERRMLTDDSGDYEISDLPPGAYQIGVDPETVPANYAIPSSTQELQVTASATAVVHLPVSALRSISGRVFFRAPARGDRAGTPDGTALVPLAGIRVTASGITAVTDNEGRFLLRQLAAGDLVVSVTPVAPLPDGLTAPSGKLRLPTDPIQVIDATIVIDNPRLVEFLSDVVRVGP